MKPCVWWWVCISLAFGLGHSKAAPPTDLSGFIYRDETIRSFLRIWKQRTIDFGPDGTFETVLAWTGSTIGSSHAGSIVHGYEPPMSGTYTCESLSAGRLMVRLFDSEAGLLSELDLDFDDDTGGDVECVDYVEANGSTVSIAHGGNFFIVPRDRTGPLVNISTRATAEPGKPIIVGFVVRGNHPTDLLIRAIGPGLTQFGIQNVWTQPGYHTGPILAYGDDSDFPSLKSGGWSAEANAQATNERAFARAGCFPIEAGSKDISDVVRVPAGTRTIVINPPEGDAGGEVLIEVYEL